MHAAFDFSAGGSALMWWGLSWVVAYLVGAVPFGLILGKTRGVDIREHGSGNIGATNLLRVCGRRVGLIGFALDVAKGSVPALVVGLVAGLLSAAGRGEAGAGELAAWMGVGVAAMLGHVFPVYLRFKGGKGVATSFGMLLAYWPFTTLAALGAFGVWCVLVWRTRYVSVGSIGAAVALPVLVAGVLAAGWFGGVGWEAGWPFFAATTALGVLVIVKHRGNIARLRAGTEGKIGAGKGRG